MSKRKYSKWAKHTAQLLLEMNSLLFSMFSAQAVIPQFILSHFYLFCSHHHLAANVTLWQSLTAGQGTEENRVIALCFVGIWSLIPTDLYQLSRLCSLFTLQLMGRNLWEFSSYNSSIRLMSLLFGHRTWRIYLSLLRKQLVLHHYQSSITRRALKNSKTFHYCSVLTAPWRAGSLSSS